jgi:hypothetical protein
MDWKQVFNPEYRWWGDIELIRTAAHNAKYPYFAWNDRVYDTLTYDVTEWVVRNGLLVLDLEEKH